ncbi:MAG: 30S ribosomal protein S20 [Opitutae bacterium]|nr:30S ribosomal protein S20 [Opitutae bacterium]
MANTKSAEKATRKSARNAARNKSVLTRLKTLHQKFEVAAEKGDAATARAAGIAYSSAMDKAAKKKVIHKNAASHAKSHVAKFTLAAKA